MGITLHYSFEFKGTRREVEGKLNEAAKIARMLGFKVVNSLWELNYDKPWDDKEENERQGGTESDGYRWAKLQLGQRANFVGGYGGYVFRAWAGEGCEPTNIGLITKDGENWTGNAFTKTQYAVDFLKCHLLVIALLDGCKKLGILKSVMDEGGYWETRDVKVLSENINTSTAYISQMKRILDSHFDGESTSPIDKCKNFLYVKKKEGCHKRGRF